jgi:poly-gamma-glutamate synthesis protein (capsule biosynthesis protein)
MKTSRLASTCLLLLLAGCVPAQGVQPSATPSAYAGPPTNTPFLPEGFVPPTATPVAPVPSPTSTSAIVSLYLSPAVPPQLADYARATGLPMAAQIAGAGSVLEPVNLPADGETTQWVYALVAPFPTLVDDVSLTDLQAAWSGAEQGPFAGRPLWMDESTLAAFTALWGAPGAGSVRVAEPAQLLDSAWAEQPAWGILPFEQLEPRWKVLSVDGQSPIHNDFDPAAYPLKVTFRLQPPFFDLPESNRDPQKLTVLIMTGVTALVRMTAYRMETNGLTYPGQDVGDIFRAADLLHISNEVPFAEDCPYPYPIQTTLNFCSDVRYITLLEDIGADIVELTGNHFQDHGSAATLLTIDMYDQRGWTYFGGGRDRADAQKAALVEHNGNRLAFIGCNPVGLPHSWATDTRPGSAECDFDFMHSEITRLRAEGYLPIVTFQHWEYYRLTPTAAQMDDFRGMAGAGAVIVSGSQSHFPQYMEFYNNAYIHYGLGNLFFDQMDYPAQGTRREFADRHVFYDGRHISTELLTFMLEDYARPRPMLDEERTQFLTDVFQAGGLLP